jgi:hypothetical protein
MAGKTTSRGKQTKRKPGKGISKTGASQARSRKVEAMAEKLEQDTGTKTFHRFEGEIPEGLAYFLDVYGRLGRG